MNYQEAIEYLFNSAPLFQNIGAGAYKEGLSNTHLLDNHFQHPHQSYRTIHVGGTNGKGSTCHTIAAILQAEGYKVGLYTSPHLLDFRERIRVNGEMIPESSVIEFIEKEKAFFEPLHPSFFELTTALAFKYFKEKKVDVAVIEVGLGGRLDCTNIIHPDLSIITNISYDHTQFLGNTLEKIAEEKAGIIKSGTPVIIGESDNSSVRNVFLHKAQDVNTPIVFADEENEIISFERANYSGILYTTKNFGTINAELGGMCQNKNTSTILEAIKMLREIGYKISDNSVKNGFKKVCMTTGLMGRWQEISVSPKTICDTGHNVGGMQYIIKQLEETPHEKLHIVIGMVSDKDINAIMDMLPKNAIYYFTQASVKRAMDCHKLAIIAKEHKLNGNVFENVAKAYENAKANASPKDLIYVGGSTFIVADMLKNINYT